MAVLAAVSRATGVGEKVILSRVRGQENTDARWIVVQLLSDMGYYPSRVAALTGISQRHVNHILSAVRLRENSSWKFFGNNLERCRRVLGLSQEIQPSQGA